MRLPNSHRILVELPGVKEPQRVRDLLQGTASLEFWLTYDAREVLPALVRQPISSSRPSWPSSPPPRSPRPLRPKPRPSVSRPLPATPQA